MRKRIAEIIILASFLAIFIVTDRNSASDIKTTETELNITDTTQVECTKLLKHITLESEQEAIRNEIYYGELEEIALVVQAEAGNQDELGKRYVADVVFNRIDSKDFPDTALDVIYQIEPVQFVTTVDGAMGKAGYTISEDVFQIVLEEAEKRTNSDIIYFKTEGYHECGTPAFEHGDHFFSTK